MSLIYTSSFSNSSTSSSSSSKRNSIYIGGRSDAKSLDKLERWNVTHILNVTTTKDSSLQAGVPNFFEKQQRRRFTYKRIPIYDSSTSVPQLEEEISTIIKFISNGLCHGSVLVHCQHGVSRSTTCVVLYLMSKVGLSLKESIEMIQRRRPEAKPIPAFYQLLQKYETKLMMNEKDNNNGDDDNKNKKKKRDATSSSIEGGGAAETTTNKKKKMGPAIGPSIGPSMMPRKQQIGPSLIGPASGPSMKKGPSTRPPAEETSSPKIIGPSIGPTMKKDILSTTSTTQLPSKSEVIGPAIGPEGGPSSSPSSSTTKDPIIGPAIGPPRPAK